MSSDIRGLNAQSLLDCLRSGRVGSTDTAELERTVLAGCRTDRRRLAALATLAERKLAEFGGLTALRQPSDGLAIERTVVVTADHELWSAYPVDPETGGLGLAWSVAGNATLPAAQGRDECRIAGRVGLDDVDWPLSALVRAVRQHDIRLKPGAMVEIAAIIGPDGRNLMCAPVGTRFPAGRAMDDHAIADLLALDRAPAMRSIIEAAYERGLKGWGGWCGTAAIAINRTLFAGRGTLVAGVNRPLWEAGHLVGHVAVDAEGACWDADGQPKVPGDIQRWGRISRVDAARYRKVATDRGIALTDEGLGETEFLSLTEDEVLSRFVKSAADQAVLGHMLHHLRSATDGHIAAHTPGRPRSPLATDLP